VFAVLLLLLAVVGLAVSNVLIGQEVQQKEEALERERQTAYSEQQTAYRMRIALAEREWSANNLKGMLQLLHDCPPDLRGWEWHYLQRLRLKVLPPLGHDSAVFCAALSPDGERITSATQDGKVTIWDAQSGRQLFQFRAHEKHARDVAYSPDGRLLATASWDNTVKIWDAKTGQLLRELEAHRTGVSKVAFSPDGQRLASVGWVRMRDERGAAGEMKVWDVTTGQSLLTVPGHGGRMDCVAFSPDGKRLATGSSDSTVTIWDAQTGEELRTFRGHSEVVHCVAFSPDGRLLASAGGARNPSEQDVKVWDGETGQELFTVRGHLGRVFAVAFSPDGRRLASASADRTVKLWDVATGKEALTLRGHLDTVLSVVFSRDGLRLVSGGADRTVRVWDATPATDEDQNCLTLPGPGGACTSVAFHPKDQRSLAAAYSDGNVRVWNLAPSKPRCFATLAVDQEGDVSSLAFSCKGQWLAAVGAKTLKVWDARTYQEVRTILGDPKFYCVAFSPDERQVAAAGLNDFRNSFPVRVWDIANGKEPRVLSGNTWVVLQLAFSPDGRQLASAGNDGTVRIWDLTTGKKIDIPPLTPPCRSYGLAYSPDGKQLAVGSNDQVVRVWDTADWKLHEYHDPGGVPSVAFSPVGKRLAWGSTDSTVKVWDISAGRAGGVSPPIHTLRGHTSWVLSVAFSPDGEQIASASADGTVKIWNTPR
jgi:WD40 repeat protein